ncbi:type VI secretion system ATPase TssH [Pseudomonas sp. SCB32]|uniref:type VI secretion system ATPase TssH n=1 Tax=Pseudomonas sp. SCB32 TaxID=2653853 RepID=UPI001264414E|nr:type VI secretion system ATPase TssH [Pseudomonas sp. SCB32]
MSDISRISLFGRLNPLLYRALEGATAFCKLRGNPYVELSHWLQQLLEEPASDLRCVIAHFEIDETQLRQDLQRALDTLPRGASSVSDFAEMIDLAVERSWVYCSLLFEASRVRSAHLLLACLRQSGLRSVLLGISSQFSRVLPDVLIQSQASILASSPEHSPSDGAPAPKTSDESGGALQRFAIDLTERARRGELDPVYGRDDEVRQMIDILMRRRQNNPLLTGEAGVGKTAIVEELALRLARGDVPEKLQGVRLHVLDPVLLQAGAGVKGEFEQRLKQVIDEVENNSTPIILFIDEVHTLVGAGGTAGTGDAANMLKPALARGRLRTIGATTWSEYKKYIEKDPALSRRFQTIQVAEPAEDSAIEMLRSLVPALEQHHGVLIEDAALQAAVRLSHRYIPARQLPDKAVSLLDTACARIAMSLASDPAELEHCLRQLELLEMEQQIAERESRICMGDARRPTLIQERMTTIRQQVGELEQRCALERGRVERILAMRRQLDEVDLPLTERTGLQAELGQLQAKEFQPEPTLLRSQVDIHTVATVIADWTGIPLGNMVQDEAAAILALPETLSRRIIGQQAALETISRRIRTARARLDDPNKPVGVFLLCGPSGVGKTETALALAQALYGGEQNLVTLNMSEFQEAHTVSTLKGSPPGYVGYGEGGVLTEAVRRRPYSVVLLDEIEKAHSDVHELFLQVFDKGWMEDGEGRYIDFKSTVILLTTNLGSERIASLCDDPELTPAAEVLANAIYPDLRQVFAAELLGRLVVVPYLPLDGSALGRIIRLQLLRIGQRLQQQHGLELRCDDCSVELIAQRCTRLEAGGRMIESILSHEVLPELSQLVLTAGPLREHGFVRLTARDGRFQLDHETRPQARAVDSIVMQPEELA